MVRHVTRRGERRWVIDIHYTTPDGKRVRFRRDAEIQTRAAAQREEQERLALLFRTGNPAGSLAGDRAASVAAEHQPAAAQTTAPPPPRVSQPAASAAPTFEVVVKEFLGEYAQSSFKASTRRGYTICLESFLLPRLRNIPVDRVDADAVRRFDAELVRDGAKPSTRRNMQLALRSVLCRFCVERRILLRAPEMPKLPRVGLSARRAPSDEEIDRLLAVTPMPYLTAFLLACDAGLRAGEIRALRWSNVDLAREVLVVERATSHGVTDVPKSGHQRAIPLTARLRAHLAAIESRPRNGFVTRPAAGEAWAEHALGHAFGRYARKAAIEGYTLHGLRHAFVSRLFRAGVGAPTVQRLAGHEHLVTTQRYAHATETDLRAAIARLGGARTVTVAVTER